MTTIYDILRCKKGWAYKDKGIIDQSFLRTMPKIKKAPGELQGNSRIHGDASPEVQDRVIDMLIEIGVRYKMTFREIAYALLMCKLESGFNPDATAGTTTASGLGQYTAATVEEAAKDKWSLRLLKFTLDLSGAKVFEAERGAYGMILSFFICKEKAIEREKEMGRSGADYEKYIYLHHHEGWFINHSEKRMEKKNTKDVMVLRDTKIVPFLAPLTKLLSEKTTIAFKLLTNDDKPFPDQPYIAIHPAVAAGKSKPQTVQQAAKKPTFVVGKTDGEGKTKPIETSSGAEVIFVILNRHFDLYKDIAKTAPKKDVHVVKKNETLARIAAEEGVSVAELQRLNNIKDINKISKDQKLKLHDGEYLWRRPPMDLIAKYLQEALNINPSAAAAVVEHKRSHINLPNGNATQRHGKDKDVVVIRAGSTAAKVAEKKKTVDIPHKTVEKKIEQKVVVPPAAAGTVFKPGLLFPLPQRVTSYKTVNAAKYNSSRSGGTRRHAGCDLYAPLGTAVRAMADGVVISCGNFYGKTDSIEVEHGDFIVRYGEVKPMTKDQRKELVGKEVSRGDTLGHVGQLYITGNTPHNVTMLHLEIFSTNSRAPFKVMSTPNRRRSDVINPADTLDKCVME